LDEPTVSTAAPAGDGRVAGFDAGPSEQGRMLRTLIGNLDGLVYRCRSDACWTMEFVSEGCERLTGYPAADLLHNRRISFDQIVHPHDLELLAQVAETAARTRERYTIEYRIVRADGGVRWVWERGTPVFGPDSKLVAFEGFIEDITERKSDQERIAHQASYDALTGLANRSLRRRSGGRARRGGLRRPGQLQVHQRHLRPPARRHAAAGDGRAAQGLRARDRHGGPPGRRRIRARADALRGRRGHHAHRAARARGGG
jgi:PAS domain S-box-containing protein